MNKLFAFALLALVAACTAATLPEPEVALGPGVTGNTEAGEVTAHEQDKRAILYRTPVAAYYPGYRYRIASPASALSYLTYPSIPYYGSYVI